MKKKLLLILLNLAASCHARSPYRIQDPEVPLLMVKNSGDSSYKTLRASYLRYGPLFKSFDPEYLASKKLPHGPITYRYQPTTTINGSALSDLIEKFLAEVVAGKEQFTDFVVLKKRDLRKFDHTGLIIAKFKNYPFVVKLFRETPESFVTPYKKGFEPCCFFIMGGGTRHLNGFTRLKNLEDIKARIDADPYWSAKISTPRKWFWMPEQEQWLELIGYRIGKNPQEQTRIPAVYAIVADYIEYSREFDLRNPADRAEALELANFLEQRIDPHINNYVIEKSTGKIVPIDYEFFPSVVGLNRYEPCTSYPQWYTHLGAKMVKDSFLLTKDERRAMHYSTYTPLQDY